MAAASLSFGEQIREELTCSICLELFTRPKVLPCQHTFCQDCLEVHARKEGMSKCPNCRESVTLPSQGVAGLPDNSMAASMCERFKQQAMLSTKEQPQPRKKCTSHPTQDVKLYCKQCQIPVCEVCLEETHDDHRTTTIKKAAQALIDEGRNILDVYYTFIRGLGETETALNKKKEEMDKSIMQSYNQMVQKLTERKDHLLSKAEQDHKKNLAKIKNGRDNVAADVDELSTACDQAEQEMERGGVKLVGPKTSLKEVVGKYRGKAVPTPVQTQPAVFQPTDTPVPVLGHVKAGGISHHQGNQKQGEQQPEKVTFGGRGEARGKFKDPVGVAISDEGEIFVADRGNKRIQVFTLQGTFVREFTTSWKGGQKMNPQDVALDGEGNPWVVGWTAESQEFAVQYNKYCRWGTGEVLRTIQLQTIRSRYRGVAVDTRRNHILITQTTGDDDNAHGEVLVFRPDGTLVRTVGISWMDWFTSLFWQHKIQMKHPRYITVDGEGNILVSDWGSNRVFVFDEYGQLLLQFEECKLRNGNENTAKLKGSRGICTDRAGNIIVADTENNCVKMFDKKGKFLKDVAQDMQQPWAVAMATQGPLVVTDSWMDTVTIFQKH